MPLMSFDRFILWARSSIAITKSMPERGQP